MTLNAPTIVLLPVIYTGGESGNLVTTQQQLEVQYRRITAMIPLPNQNSNSDDDPSYIISGLGSLGSEEERDKYLPLRSDSTELREALRQITKLREDFGNFNETNSIFAAVYPNGTFKFKDGDGISYILDNEYSSVVWSIGQAHETPEDEASEFDIISSYYHTSRHRGSHEITHAFGQRHPYRLAEATDGENDRLIGFCFEYEMDDLTELNSNFEDRINYVYPDSHIGDLANPEIVTPNSTALLPESGDFPLLGPLGNGHDKEIWGLDIGYIQSRYDNSLPDFAENLIVSNPRRVFAITSYCRTKNYLLNDVDESFKSNVQNGWLDSEHHQRIIDFINHVSPVEKIARASSPVLSDLFTGSIGFDSSGSVARVEVDTVFSRPRPITSSSLGDYTLEFLDSSGSVLQSNSFSADESLEFNLTEPEVSSQAFFSILVENPPDYHSFTIKQDGTELFSLTRSSDAPDISISGITENQLFSKGEAVDFSWVGSDKDEDSLTYRIYYSLDGGRSYEPLIAETTGTNLSVSTDYLRGSNTARIGISASDGTRSTFAETPVFRVTQNAPEVRIETPSEILFAEQGLVLDAQGYDQEDGALGLEDFSWSSSIDGNLGVGQYIVLSTDELTEGDHIITVTGTDSSGLSSTDSINATIKKENTIPEAKNDISVVPLLEIVDIDVLANDIDTENDVNIIEIIDEPAFGNAEAVYNSEGKLVVSYRGHTSGLDTFRYQACDGIGRCSIARVAVFVGLKNIPLPGPGTAAD